MGIRTGEARSFQPLIHFSGVVVPAASIGIRRREETKMAIHKVGVVGCGLMGSGIAQVSAQAGFQTAVREVSAELVEKGLKGIEKNLARLVEKGSLTEAVKSEIRGRLKGTTSLEDLKDCDVILEAIIEQLPAKKELFTALDGICGPNTIFASNTSSLTITEIAAATKRPERFVGLHFFNPVPVMKKCKPTKRSGRFVAAAISVIVREEVLLAKMVFGPQIASSAENSSLFAGSCSMIASMITSQSFKPSREVVPCNRPRTSLFAASVSAPFSTSRARFFSIPFSPFSTRSALTSRTSV